MLRLEPLPDRLTPAAVQGTAGNDLFVLFASTPTSATLIRYDANGVLADARLLTNATTVTALGGDDELRVAGAIPVPVTFVGGAGTDTVTQQAASGFTLADASYTVGGGAGVTFDATTERLNATGTSGIDTFRVRGGTAGTAVNISGGGGTDELRFEGLPSAYITDAAGRVTVRRADGSAPVSFDPATVAAATITGTPAADWYVFQLSSAATAFTVDAGGGANGMSVAGPSAFTVTPDGTWDAVSAPGVGGVRVLDATAGNLSLSGAASITVNGGGLPATYLYAAGAGPTQITVNGVGVSNLANAGGQGWLSVSGAKGFLFPDTANYAVTLNGTAGADNFYSTGPMTAATLTINGGGGLDSLWVRNLQNASYTTAGGVGTVRRAGAAALRFGEGQMAFVYLTGTPGDDAITLAPDVARGTYLEGFGGNDTFTGGAGNDYMVGDGGDDNLYGGGGNDYLLGGAGQDGLFGGTGANVLTGGAGDDRFLLWSAGVNTIADPETGDAQIRFTPGTADNAQGNAVPAEWRDDEIVNVDTAIGDLNRYTGNAALLKTGVGVSMGFQRWADTTVNGVQVLGWNFGEGVVSFTSAILGGPALNLWATVYHEFGHNWDAPDKNPTNAAFRALSGWTVSPPANAAGYGVSDPAYSYGQAWFYLQSARFARGYGALGGPAEDYATTWETALSVRFHGTAPAFENGTPNALIPAKAANVWAFIDGLKS